MAGEGQPGVDLDKTKKVITPSMRLWEEANSSRITVEGLRSIPEMPGMARQLNETEMELRVAEYERNLDRACETTIAQGVLEDPRHFAALAKWVVRKALVLERELKSVLRYTKEDPELLEIYDGLREEMLNLHDRFEDIAQALPAGDKSRTAEAKRFEDDARGIFLRMLQLDAHENSSPEQAPAVSALTAARQAHENVKVMYASIQHTLSEDQRRSFRSRIASLSGMVRRAEDQAWRGLFATAPARPAKDEEVVIRLASTDYFQSQAHVNAAVELAVSRAMHTAPAIADASLNPI